MMNIAHISALIPTQNLAGKDRKTIDSLKQAIMRGDYIEPIQVENSKNGPAIKDGHHRYLAYKEMGVTDIPVEEYKRGGALKRQPKGKTSKNIQSSINEILFKRNEMIFGPSGKKYFKPFLEGGENDKPMKKNISTKELGFPQQPTAQQFYERGYVPNSPVGFYMHGGMNTNMIAFPQQPDAAHFFSGFPWDPKFKQGGMPCFECGGAHMDEGGSIFGYGNFPATQYGGNVGMNEADDDMLEMYKKGGNWIQAANKKMKAKGTKGAFTEYCGGKVTEACIQRGLNSPDPTIRKRAAFAKAMHKIRKADGGESPQGYNMDNVLDSNNSAFKAFLADNTMSALQNEVEQEIFNMGGNNFNYANQDKLNYANQMMDQMNERGQMINQNFWGQTANMLGNMRAFDEGGSNPAPANTPSYLTKEDLEKYFQEKFGQQQQQYGYPQGYGYGQPVSYYRGQGMQGYFPMNPMGPYYKTKFKGWSNVPTTYGMPQQYAGMMSGAPATSGQMTEDQMKEYQKYWADRGVNAEISQDVKRGLLGKWLGPRRVQTSVKFSMMPGQNPGVTNPSQQQQQNTQPVSQNPAQNTQSNFSNYPTTTDQQGGYDFLQIGSTPVNKEQFMQGKINQDLQMMNPNVPAVVPAPQSGIPYAEPNMMTAPEGWNKYGGLNMFANGGTEPGLNTAGPLEWGFNTVEKRKMGFAPGTADWMVGAEYAGANLLGNVLGANRSEKKAMEEWMRSKQGADANYYAMQMDKGDHTKDVYGTDTLMPDQIGVKVEPWAMGQFQGNRGDAYYQGKYGGAFMAQGGATETYMTDEEIKQFMAMGGRVEFLD